VIDCNEWKTETPQMHQYGESKTTRLIIANAPHVTSGLGFRKFQADGFLFDRVYIQTYMTSQHISVWSMLVKTFLPFSSPSSI